MKNHASNPCLRLNKAIRSSFVTKKRMGVLIRPVLASRVIRGYTIAHQRNCPRRSSLRLRVTGDCHAEARSAEASRPQTQRLLASLRVTGYCHAEARSAEASRLQTQRLFASLRVTSDCHAEARSAEASRLQTQRLFASLRVTGYCHAEARSAEASLGEIRKALTTRPLDHLTTRLP